MFLAEQVQFRMQHFNRVVWNRGLRTGSFE